MKRLLTVLFVLLILGSPVNLFSQPLNISSYAEVYLQNDLRLGMPVTGLSMTRNGRIYATMGSCIYYLGDYLESYGLKGKVKSVKQKFLRANADMSGKKIGDYILRDMHFYPNGRMKEVYYKFSNYYYILVKSVFDGDSLIEVHQDWYNYKTDYIGEYVREKDRFIDNVYYIIPSGKNKFIPKQLHKGKKVGTRCFCIDNNHLSSSLDDNRFVEYLYDKNGNLTESSEYFAKKFEKGKFISSNFFEYDSDGRIKSWRTSELDTLVSTFEYDENGFINEYIFWHCYGPYRNNFVKCRISCKKDIMGNPLEYRAESLDEYYNSHGGAVDFVITNCLAVGVFDYEWDKNGNYISKRYTLNGVLQYIVERDIEYY